MPTRILRDELRYEMPHGLLWALQQLRKPILSEDVTLGRLQFLRAFQSNSLITISPKGSLDKPKIWIRHYWNPLKGGYRVCVVTCESPGVSEWWNYVDASGMEFFHVVFLSSIVHLHQVIHQNVFLRKEIKNGDYRYLKADSPVIKNALRKFQ